MFDNLPNDLMEAINRGGGNRISAAYIEDGQWSKYDGDFKISYKGEDFILRLSGVVN